MVCAGVRGWRTARRGPRSWDKPSVGMVRLHAAGPVLAVVVSLLAVSCSAESGVPQPGTATTLVVTVAPSHTLVSEVTTTVPPTGTTSVPLSTTTTARAPVGVCDEVLAYVTGLAAAKETFGGILVGMMEFETARVDPKEAVRDPPRAPGLLDDVLAGVRELEAAVRRMHPPPVGLVQPHGTFVEAVGHLSDAADEVLAGFRSPDAGFHIRRALGEFWSASDRLTEVIQRLGETVDVMESAC